MAPATLNQRDSKGFFQCDNMDQDLLIPLLGEWTSINPSYFWCELQGYYWFWHTAMWLAMDLWSMDWPAGKISRKPIDFDHDFSMTTSTVIMVLSADVWEASADKKRAKNQSLQVWTGSYKDDWMAWWLEIARNLDAASNRTNIWLVVWNIFFSISWEEESQLTNFFGGVETTN